MTQAAGTLDAGLWRSVARLLRLRLLIFVSGFRRAKTRQKVGLVLLAVAVLAILAFAFFLSWALLRLLRSPELAQITGDLTTLIESVPVIVVGMAFLIVLLTSFGMLLQGLYLAGDMDFLMSAPVPMRAVFVAKLLQAILPTFGLICLFALPVLFGLGTATEYTWLYYPLVPVLLAAMAVAAAGVSSLLVMAVVRLFPARRVAEVLGFVVGVATLVCSQSGRFAQVASPSAEQVGSALRAATVLNTPWSPLAWAGRGLVAIGEGRWASGATLVGLSLGLAGLVFGVTLTIAERLYYRGWASMQDRRRRRAAPRKARAMPSFPLAAWAARGAPSTVRAIVVKDARVLRRDLRNLSQLITPLILGVVYAVALVRSGGTPPAGRGEAPAWFMESFESLLELGNVAIALFVGYSLVGRLAGIGFSQEGKSYWLLKTAPISAVQLVTAKFWIAYLPSLALSWAFVLLLAIVQAASPATAWFAFPVVAFCLAGATGISLAFGIVGAKMDWEDPRQMQSGRSGCLGMLVAGVFLLVALGLFQAPVLGVGALGLPAWSGQLAGLAVGGLFSLACTLVPLRLTMGRVPRLGES
jgi:ABC-2 type transport system permease protein